MRQHFLASWKGVLVMLSSTLALCAFVAATMQQSYTTYHVALSGLDSNPGTLQQPFRTVQQAANVVSPGDTILVHPGVYNGQVVINRSGAPGKFITLRPAVTAVEFTARLEAAFSARPCTERAPAYERTIMIANGTDYWFIRDLDISNGIFVSGSLTDLQLRHRVRDRTLPGRSNYDPKAADATLPAVGSNGADYIRIVNNNITKRGIYTSQARYMRITGNEIHEIDCATGGGIWLSRFSDKAIVSGNHIHDVLADSTTPHWQSEGIRLGSASMYNLIEDNIIENLGPGSRGIGADVQSGWNIIRRNYAARADHGLSDQAGNWGNRWVYNVSDENRKYGFSLSVNGSYADSLLPKFVNMTCNESRSEAVALRLGAAHKSTFSNNKFDTVVLNDKIRTEWGQVGNKWDGSSRAPPRNPDTASFANCPTS